MYPVLFAVFVWCVVFSFALLILLLCVFMAHIDLKGIAISFLFMNVSFICLMLAMVFNSVCDEKKFDSTDSLNIQFISTRMLQCKYSPNISCLVLPPAIAVNVTILIIQLHHTTCLLGTHNRTMCDAFAYIAVLGWVAIMLFDSQRVSDRESREHVHALGVVLLSIGLFALHYISIFSSSKNRQMAGAANGSFSHIHSAYKAVEALYLVLSCVFFFLFLTGLVQAIIIEYFVFVVVVVLSFLNLAIQALTVVNMELNSTVAVRAEIRPPLLSSEDRAVMILVASIPLTFTFGLCLEFTTAIHSHSR